MGCYSDMLFFTNMMSFAQQVGQSAHELIVRIVKKKVPLKLSCRQCVDGHVPCYTFGYPGQVDPAYHQHVCEGLYLVYYTNMCILCVRNF